MLKSILLFVVIAVGVNSQYILPSPACGCGAPVLAPPCSCNAPVMAPACPCGTPVMAPACSCGAPVLAPQCSAPVIAPACPCNASPCGCGNLLESLVTLMATASVPVAAPAPVLSAPVVPNTLSSLIIPRGPCGKPISQCTCGSAPVLPPRTTCVTELVLPSMPVGCTNPFLPAASPVSALAPQVVSPILPPVCPSENRCIYLRKIPIPPPCL